MILRKMAEIQDNHNKMTEVLSGTNVGGRRREKPVLDEKRLAEFVRVIGVSMFTEKPVKIKVFLDNGDLEVIGLIDKVAADTRQLKIGFENSYEWVVLDDVIEMKILI